jgi:hypothetical protein
MGAVAAVGFLALSRRTRLSEAQDDDGAGDQPRPV